MIKYFVRRNFRGRCSSVERLKGYMVLCGNAEGAHGQRKVGNPCSSRSESSIHLKTPSFFSAGRCGSCRAGVPKLSLAMYPFSISIHEHVPLNMGAGFGFFSREGPVVDFPGVGQNIFAVGQKWKNYISTTRNWENNLVCKNMMRKCPISKSGEALALFSTPVSLKLPMTKRLRE